MNFMGPKPVDYCPMSTDYSGYLNSGLHPTVNREGITQKDMTSENWSQMSNQEPLQGYVVPFTDYERQSQGTDPLSNCFSPNSFRAENGSTFYTDGSDGASAEFKANAYQGLLCQQMIADTNSSSSQQYQDEDFRSGITSSTSDFLSIPVALTDESLRELNSIDMNLAGSTVYSSSMSGMVAENSGCSFSNNIFQNFNGTTSNSKSSSTLRTQDWHERQHVKAMNVNGNSNEILNTGNPYSSRGTETDKCNGKQQDFQELTEYSNPSASYVIHGEHTNQICPSPIKVHADIFNQSGFQEENAKQSPGPIEQPPVFDSSAIVSGLDELAKAMAENVETARLIETALVSQKGFDCEHSTFPSSNTSSMECPPQSTKSLSSHSRNLPNPAKFYVGCDQNTFEHQLQTEFVPDGAPLASPPEAPVSSSISMSVHCRMAHKRVEGSKRDISFPETFQTCYISAESPSLIHVITPDKSTCSESNSYVGGPSDLNCVVNTWMEGPKNDSYFKTSPQVHEELYYSPRLDASDLSSSSSEDNHFLFGKSEITFPLMQTHNQVNKLCEDLDSPMRESASQVRLNKDNVPITQENFGDLSSAQENYVDRTPRYRRRKIPKPSSLDAGSNGEKPEDYREFIPPKFQTYNNQTSSIWEASNEKYTEANDTMTRDNRHLSEKETSFAETCSVIHKKFRSENGQPRVPISSRNILKVCGVCGDRAKSMHFGGMACDSCKAFFRRSVQGKCWTEFQCSAEKICAISKKNRKNCQYCRFAKCRKNGMDMSWVMTEAERMTMWKNRLKKHKKEKKRFRGKIDFQNDVNFTESLETCSESSADEPDDTSKDERSKTTSTENFQTSEASSNELPCDRQNFDIETCSTVDPESIESIDVTNSSITEKIFSNAIEGTSVTTFSKDHPLNKSDVITMNNLIALLTSVFTNNPFPASCSGDTFSALTTIFFSVCQKMGSFFQRVDDFKSVPHSDQIYLLRAGVSTSIYFFGAYNFDGDTMSWPRKSGLKVLKIPPVSEKTVMQLAQSSETYATLIKFYLLLWRDLQDEGVLALMSLLSLFQVRDNYEEVKDRRGVLARREKYIQLLSHYLRFRQGERGSSVTLPKLLSGLNEVWKIAENHSKVDIQSSMLTPNELIPAESSTPHSDLMDSLLTLVENLAVQPFPAHSSVLINPSTSPTEASSVEQEHQSSNFHHPITNAIFGNETPGRLLNCSDELILKGLENYQKIGHSSMTSDSEKKLSTLNEAPDVQDTQRKSPTVTGNPGPVSNRVTSADCSSSESTMSEQGATSLTQEGIGAVCEVLEYISQSDDPEAIKSLKKCLPPSVLKALASKLNDGDGSS